MEIRQPYPPGAPHDRGPGYERRDANVRGLLQFAFWMAMVLVVTLVGMKYTFDHFKKVQPLGATTSPMVSETERTLPPKPRLQVQPHLELAEFCAAQEQSVEQLLLDQSAGGYRPHSGGSRDGSDPPARFAHAPGKRGSRWHAAGRRGAANYRRRNGHSRTVRLSGRASGDSAAHGAERVSSSETGKQRNEKRDERSSDDRSR